ncbi:MAG: hypothetical protein R3F42_08585 [Pseudomonadota bacterium]
MAILGGVFTRIECGCNVRLNLAGLHDDAAAGFAAFDPAEFRGLLLSYADFFDDCSDDRRCYIQQVPLSATLWLFSAGVLGLVGLSSSGRRIVGE